MDDTTASLKNETSALQLYQEMVTLLEQAGMHLHKRTLGTYVLTGGPLKTRLKN